MKTVSVNKTNRHGYFSLAMLSARVSASFEGPAPLAADFGAIIDGAKK